MRKNYGADKQPSSWKEKLLFAKPKFNVEYAVLNNMVLNSANYTKGLQYDSPSRTGQ